jgi:hypothetical protein
MTANTLYPEEYSEVCLRKGLLKRGLPRQNGADAVHGPADAKRGRVGTYRRALARVVVDIGAVRPGGS